MFFSKNSDGKDARPGSEMRSIAEFLRRETTPAGVIGCFPCDFVTCPRPTEVAETERLCMLQSRSFIAFPRPFFDEDPWAADEQIRSSVMS
jgi:hypothetical protein